MGCCSSKKDVYEVIPSEIIELSKHQCEYEMNDSTSITFYPSPHLKKSDYGSDILQHELFTSSSRLHNILTEIQCNNLISCNDDDLMIIQQESKINPFIECAIRAWSHHYPLTISPQHIWLLILQGINLHIASSNMINNKFIKLNSLNNNAYANNAIPITPLPSQIHTGMNMHNSYDYSTTGTVNNKEWIVKIKEFLTIIENDVVLDEKTNDILSSFSFTSSSYLDELACKLSVLNSVVNTYEYNEDTACGFTSITLRGKKADWLELREKTTNILDKKCGKVFNIEWRQSLLPILDRFISVYDGDIDCVFWNSMIKRGAMNSSNKTISWYSGWINCFFPVINNHENQWCEPYSFDIGYIKSGLKNEDTYGGIELNSFPLGLCQADAVIVHNNNNNTNDDDDNSNSNDGTPTLSDVDNNDNNENIKIIAGFLGYTQNQLNYSLQPNVGWFVVGNTNNKAQNDGHTLPGLTEDEFDDEYDPDAPLFTDNKSTPNPYIRSSDPDDCDDDLDDGLNGLNDEYKKRKKNKKKLIFMKVDQTNDDDLDDDDDDVQQKLHVITGK